MSSGDVPTLLRPNLGVHPVYLLVVMVLVLLIDSTASVERPTVATSPNVVALARSWFLYCTGSGSREGICG